LEISIYEVPCDFYKEKLPTLSSTQKKRKIDYTSRSIQNGMNKKHTKWNEQIANNPSNAARIRLRGNRNERKQELLRIV